MENLILILLGVIILTAMVVLVKTVLWQKKVSTHLLLSKNKNNQILIKQSSFLVLSVAVFTFALSQQGYLAIFNDHDAVSSLDSRSALEAAVNYSRSNDDDEQHFDVLNKPESENVIGVVTLENDGNYVLVKINDQYYLVNEQQNKVVEIESAP